MRSVLLILMLLLAACETSVSDPESGGLLAQRLSLMDEVAAYKWLNALPVEDLDREKTVVRAARDAAVTQGLDPDAAEQFFRMQIEAAKEIQLYWISVWRERDAPTFAPDLTLEIRPELLRLGDAITSALANCQAELLLGGLNIEGLEDQRKTELKKALLQAIPRSCGDR